MSSDADLQGLRILFVAYRHDPEDPAAGSGSDFQFLSALRNSGANVDVLGACKEPEALAERAVRWVWRKLLRARPHKYPLSLARRLSARVQAEVAVRKPDVVFTLYPPPVAFAKFRAPLIYRVDTTFLAQEKQYPTFDRLALGLSTWQERRVLKKAAAIVTHSDWCRRSLVEDYGVSPEKVRVIPNPAALPKEAIPSREDVCNAHEPAHRSPLRLLLVGRDFKRKGIDFALEVANELRQRGIENHLTVCGLSGTATDGVSWVGPFRKSDPEELERYLAVYRNADLLIHPAHFDASPIVPSEAAAFGVPTIARDVGGVSSIVKDGESGLLLAAESSPGEWAEAVVALTQASERFADLRRSTRNRFEEELNWEVVGRRLRRIVAEVAAR